MSRITTMWRSAINIPVGGCWMRILFQNFDISQGTDPDFEVK